MTGSDPKENAVLQDVGNTTRNYVYNLDIFPRILFQQVIVVIIVVIIVVGIVVIIVVIIVDAQLRL